MTGQQRPVPLGLGANINTRQNEIEHLRRLRAYSHMYNSAQMWRRLRAAGTLALASVAPVVAVFVPSSTDTLAAIGAGWLVIGRTVLTRLEQHARGDAVRAHELYDTRLFHLPWNQSLAGQPPSPDDIVRAAQRVPDHERYRNWYSIDLEGIPWPGDVLLCQRQSMVWSRSDHRAYGNAVLAAGLAWFTAGLTLAIVKDLSLSDYLIKIFLPCAPAFLDTSELAHEHRQHSIAREQTENDIHGLWNTYSGAPEALPIAETRRIQDSAFQLRRTGPRVPTFYYRLRRYSSEQATVTATAELINPRAAP